MIEAVGIDGVIHVLQEFSTVAGDEIDSSDLTFLQSFVGIECVAQEFGVTAQNFAVAQFGTSGAGAELIELMLHLRAGIVGGVNQGLIETS